MEVLGPRRWGQRRCVTAGPRLSEPCMFPAESTARDGSARDLEARGKHRHSTDDTLGVAVGQQGPSSSARSQEGVCRPGSVPVAQAGRTPPIGVRKSCSLLCHMAGACSGWPWVAPFPFPDVSEPSCPCTRFLPHLWPGPSLASLVPGHLGCFLSGQFQINHSQYRLQTVWE